MTHRALVDGDLLQLIELIGAAAGDDDLQLPRQQSNALRQLLLKVLEGGPCRQLNQALQPLLQHRHSSNCQIRYALRPSRPAGQQKSVP